MVDFVRYFCGDGFAWAAHRIGHPANRVGRKPIARDTIAWLAGEKHQLDIGIYGSEPLDAGEYYRFITEVFVAIVAKNSYTRIVHLLYCLVSSGGPCSRSATRIKV